MSTTPSTETPPHLDATHARSGFRGRHVLWMLLISLVLVVIALFGSWGFKAHQLAQTQPSNATAQRDAKTFDAH